MTWSPQQYIADGQVAGIDPAILLNAIDQIEEVIVPHPQLPALLTLNHLAKRTGADYQELRSVVARSENCYRHFRIRKRSGGHRVISVPEPTLMLVQRWIAAYILNHQQVHHCSFAFSPKASILKCAARHVGARWLIKLDVAGFFGSITEIQVYRVFRSLGYQPLISFELARLTTHAAPLNSARYELAQWRAKPHPSPIIEYRDSRIGYLPQGAPTSPMLSNLIMRDADAEIEAIAKGAAVRYTRYSDDLTFSTRGKFDRDSARKLIWKVFGVLRSMGLHVNHRKTTVVPPGGRKVVLGLLVDGVSPRLTRDFRSMLRQHLYYLENLGPIEHAKRRGFDSIWGMYRHVRGLIDFANMVEPLYGQAMLAQFNAVTWPHDWPADS
jgi:RNA-directed DNA polymerase